jgi:Na+/H+-dicarboxylate symporter
LDRKAKTAMTTEKKEKKKMSLSSKILIGMGLGIVVGLFFGEY